MHLDGKIRLRIEPLYEDHLLVGSGMGVGLRESGSHVALDLVVLVRRPNEGTSPEVQGRSAQSS